MHSQNRTNSIPRLNTALNNLLSCGYENPNLENEYEYIYNSINLTGKMK